MKHEVEAAVPGEWLAVYEAEILQHGVEDVQQEVEEVKHGVEAGKHGTDDREPA